MEACPSLHHVCQDVREQNTILVELIIHFISNLNFPEHDLQLETLDHLLLVIVASIGTKIV